VQIGVLEHHDRHMISLIEPAAVDEPASADVEHR
jgi:hypothetical protein